jgi:hypothetical protein
MRINLILVLILATWLPGCDKSSAPDPGDQQAAPKASAGAHYVCPMDPDVTSDKPGRCPKCGMELEIEK